MPDPIDCPAAPLDAEAESLTPAQQKCLGVPREECEGYPDCRHCPAWVEPTNRSRA